jgi:hypothetical protein
LFQRGIIEILYYPHHPTAEAIPDRVLYPFSDSLYGCPAKIFCRHSVQQHSRGGICRKLRRKIPASNDLQSERFDKLKIGKFRPAFPDPIILPFHLERMLIEEPPGSPDMVDTEAMLLFAWSSNQIAVPTKPPSIKSSEKWIYC